MSSDLIYHTLRCGPDTEDSSTPARNLRPSSIVYNVCADTQTHRLGLKHFQLVLALHLDRDLCLAISLPTLENGRCGRLMQKRFVAGQCRVPTLRGDLT